MIRYINLLIEDELHLNIATRLLQHFAPALSVHRVFGKRGKSFIKQNLSGFNRAAKHTHYLVIVDLDNDECPPSLVNRWLTFQKSSNLVFRVAVREAEAWLISDRDNFAAFMGVSKDIVTTAPENLPDPKEYVINLARRSRKRNIKDDLIPDGQATVGRNYNTCLADFVFRKWDAKKAMSNSQSLSGLIQALEQFKGR